jgi:uncharacterized membrane protein SirB2
MLPVETYPALKQAHVTLVLASGALFTLRGAAVLARAGWPMRSRWRILSVAIDTLLLAAGVALWALLALNPLRDAWLGTKLLLLVVYIVVGSVALRRGRTPAVRAASYAAALAVYGFMISVAVAHRPLGLFAAS